MENKWFVAWVMASLTLVVVCAPWAAWAAGASAAGEGFNFPPALESYNDADMDSIWSRLVHRVAVEPFNLLATLIFLLAIVHTFLSSRFQAIAHNLEDEHEKQRADGTVPKNSVSLRGKLYHFLGEVEVIFGLWAVVLGIAVILVFGGDTFLGYISHNVNFTEAMFVVVIMALASTRPILRLSELAMNKVAQRLGGNLKAWWFTVLTLGPMLGSIITEPAAMTIAALLLANKFYELKPNEAFKYATIGLLFVNVSIGGTLTHFAAPPVLMVAGTWNWDLVFMLSHFGWKAIIGMLIGNTLYFHIFRGQFTKLEEAFALRKLKDEIRQEYLRRDVMEADFDRIIPLIHEQLQTEQKFAAHIDEAVNNMRSQLEPKYLDAVTKRGVDPDLAKRAFEERFEDLKIAQLRQEIPALLPPEQRAPYEDPDWDSREDPVPWWVVWVHIGFMGWTILNAHHPQLFIAGLLFFLGFAIVTSPYQNRIDLKAPLLVGFFLAGLVVHGGLQGWWIEPVLGSLGKVPLMLSATVLSAFNDNAAITFLSTLIPNFSDELKYAVVAGAVTGGGLTVIANAPNPAGQALLKRFFKNGVSPLKLLLAALPPTIIVFILFVLLG